MYLITAYFDEKTNRKLQQLIDGIAKSSGNNFMKEHSVPPHLTISAFETRKPDGLVPVMESLRKRLSQGEVQFVSVGVFLPYVMYATPVLDEYLHDMAVEVYESVCGVDKGRQDVHDSLHRYVNVDNDGICTFVHTDNDGVCTSAQNDDDGACVSAQNVNRSFVNDMRSISGIEDINVNKYYNPAKWFPHVTLGKTLDKEQIRQAFSYVQKHFVPFTGRIVELGLARTNPHEDIVRVEIG